MARLCKLLIGVVSFFGLATADVRAATVLIDDLTDNLSATVTGIDASTLVVGIQNETYSDIGSVDITFSYRSIDPNVPAFDPVRGATSSSLGYNIYDPDGRISDRLSIRLVALSASSPSDNNVKVEISFLSAPEDPLVKFAILKLATSIVETGIYQNVASGLTDLNVQFRSDIETPLPATLSLFVTGLGTFGLLGWRSKRKRKLLAAPKSMYLIIAN